MTIEEELEFDELLEKLLWLEEEIKACAEEDYLDEFTVAYLKNLINYWEKDNKRISELISTL